MRHNALGLREREAGPPGVESSRDPRLSPCRSGARPGLFSCCAPFSGGFFLKPWTSHTNPFTFYFFLEGETTATGQICMDRQNGQDLLYPSFRKKIESCTLKTVIVNVIDSRPISSCKLPDERRGERIQAKDKVVYYTFTYS